MVKLASILNENKSLEYLSCSNNRNIGLAGLTHLSQALVQNSSLTQFDLSDN